MSQRVLNVENQGNESIRVRAYVNDFFIDADNNFIFSEPGHESYSCAKWLHLDETEFDLAPGESKKVEVIISVPAEVEPGGHYAALFFETISPPAEGGGYVSIISRIPSLFYLTIPGITDADVIADADIVSLLLPGWVGKGPVEAGVVVRNKGNVHLTIAVKAYFNHFRGGESELDLGQMVILPYSDKTLKGSWQDVPLFGRVRVSVVIGYFDQKGELVNKTQTEDFWVIPWKLIAIIVIAIGLLILLIRLMRKRYRFRMERR